jgi:hypothetical protein
MGTKISYLYFPHNSKTTIMRKNLLAFALLLFTSFSLLAQKKDEKPEPIPLTFTLLEKCLYVSADSAQKLLALAGYEPSGTPKQMEILKDKWKPSRTILFSKGNIEIIIVFNSSNVWNVLVRSESSKDKTGENLFIESLKAGYKEATHDGENPRVSKNGPKKTAKYDSNNKPWVFELTGKN